MAVRKGTMLRRLAVICFCLLTLPALCGPGAKYEVATILEVKPHQTAGENSDVPSYEISAQVGNTIYVALYSDSLGTSTVKYAAGRELLVHLEKTTVTYNDILGQSHTLPIISQKSATKAKQTK